MQEKKKPNLAKNRTKMSNLNDRLLRQTMINGGSFMKGLLGNTKRLKFSANFITS